MVIRLGYYVDNVENEPGSISKVCAIVLITKNVMYHFFPSKFEIRGNANTGHARYRGHELLCKP